MFGRNIDTDNSHRLENENTDKTPIEYAEEILGLEDQIQELKDHIKELQDSTRLNLIEEYYKEIQQFIEKLENAVPMQDEVYIKRITSYDHEINDMIKFLRELTQGI